MENKESGISFLSLLGLMFIGLKITNCIDWSWWWVLSPFWLPVAIVLAVFAFILVCATFAAAISALLKR